MVPGKDGETDVCTDETLQLAVMLLADDGKNTGFNQITKEFFKQDGRGCLWIFTFAKKVSEIFPIAGSVQIRGMSIDEAIAQLEFNDKKGAKIMKEVGRACSLSDSGSIR